MHPRARTHVEDTGASPNPPAMAAHLDDRAVDRGSAPLIGLRLDKRHTRTRRMLTAHAWRASRRLAIVHDSDPMTGRTVHRCKGHRTPLNAARAACHAGPSGVWFYYRCSRKSTYPEHHPASMTSTSPPGMGSMVTVTAPVGRAGLVTSPAPAMVAYRAAWVLICPPFSLYV